ncbi:MAG: DNA mismatch repair endonuclease MutL [Bacteroidales bacterium]|nr:DNA mismatch repair endonuclease MutL [Bacteroidales bacterium]
MADIIHLLPDSVANQIAAGEVVQRPASVVKELVENAIDAKATEITISIIDAGRTAIQITDNGVGMSETDARMAFERHATSKIKDAADIFTIRTMGFRGEALASIAAVSQTELKTRKKENELGTKIVIAGSKIESQEPESCPVGTTFTVKNLFFNTPARRKFLKANKTEFTYILAEIHQTALANPHICFTILKEGDLYAKYPSGTLKQRIINIFGKQMDKGLLAIEDESSIVKIHGFIGVPELAKKTGSNQYFFVNDRFFRQKSFLGSIMRAYGNLVPQKEYPPFFVFLEIDPGEIDVNIHPTKTEIKFSEEFNICQLLEATVKYTLGKSNIVPTLDFSDPEDYSDMFKPSNTIVTSPPKIAINPSYNPFKTNNGPAYNNAPSNARNWEKLFEDYQAKKSSSTEQTIDFGEFTEISNNEEPELCIQSCTQVQRKYIVAIVDDKIYIIDIKRAHYRLIYNTFEETITSSQKLPSQKTLLPIRIEVTPQEAETLQEALPQMNQLGIDIEEFGKQTFVINGTPSNIPIETLQDTIVDFASSITNSGNNFKESWQEHIVRTMAKSASLYRNPEMSKDEMHRFVSNLLQAKSYTITPEGQIITVIVELNDLLKKFN